MILRETPASWVLINQHDHARVAGIMAAHWNPEYIPTPARWPQVLHAVEQHDRAWINLDQQLAWDAANQKPCSFIDYPLAPKLAAYTRGIDEVAQTNAYGALLCSLHYTTFPDLETTPAGRAFRHNEEERQHKIKAALPVNGPQAEQLLHFHLQLLKFCDGLSIYLCINEPGVSKAQEHPWYREGVPYSNFSFTPGKRIQACWHKAQAVQVSPFPFGQAFTVTIPFRQVDKAQVQRQDGSQALPGAAYQHYQVQLIP
jgi:hypothetical protein